MKGKKALVTGASGFIGSPLCRRLAEKGAEVHAVSRNKQPDAEGKIHWWQADLADPAQVREIMQSVKPDFVFHLASEVTGKRDLELVLPVFQSNLLSTVSLMTEAARQGCDRFLITGSLEEPDPGLPAVPCSPYAAAKWSASGYARMFWELYKLPTVIARLFMVYGPAQKDLTKLIPYTILSLAKKEAPKFSSGQRPVDWIYVEDVVEGLVMAATAKGIEGGTLEFGSGNLVRIREVVEEIVKLMGSAVKPVFGALADRPLEQVRVANAGETFRQIGWKPRVSLRDGLERTIEWYTRRSQVETRR